MTDQEKEEARLAKRFERDLEKALGWAIDEEESFTLHAWGTADDAKESLKGGRPPTKAKNVWGQTKSAEIEQAIEKKNSGGWKAEPFRDYALNPTPFQVATKAKSFMRNPAGRPPAGPQDAQAREKAETARYLRDLEARRAGQDESDY